jgi:branched-chain amino acid transport system permease protein
MVDYATFFDIAVSGVGLGALYALVAVGFSLIYKITGVLNFAQGQIALVGAYGIIVFGTSTTFATVLPPIVAVLLTIVVGIVLGFLLERLVFRQFIGEPVLSVIIVTLALGAMIDGFLRWIVGSSFKSYPTGLVFTGNVDLPLEATINTSFAIGVVLSIVVVFVLMLFFRYTVLGSILRASASDQQAAMVLGVSIERTIVVAWTLSIAVTAIGGMLFAMANGGASISIESVGIVIFAAVVFGGLDSIPGAFIGSITVGLLQELGSFYGNPVIGPGFGEVLPLLFLMVVIVVKPYGLFGTERIERL